MSTGIDPLDLAVRDFDGWVTSVEARLNVQDPQLALASLRCTLQAIRDQLDTARAAAFANRLPLLLRGLFYDGWKPSKAPLPAENRQEFLAMVEGDVLPRLGIKAERAAKAVIEEIAHRVPAVTLAAIVDSWPADLHELWPDEPTPYSDARALRPLPPKLDETHRSRTSPSRLRKVSRRASGETTANALPERHGSKSRRRSPA